LTRQLLAFSRPLPLEPRILDLGEVAAKTEQMLRRMLGEDVTLQVDAEPRLATVRADAGQIEQIILNLAVNARDAMPRGGTLRISATNTDLDEEFARRHAGVLPGRHVALSVTDSGSGMTPEVVAHAFEPFFTTKPKGKGTGLGLAMVCDIARQSRGCATIDSAPGIGTTVTLYLPVAGNLVPPGGAPLVAASGSSGVAAPAGTETILVVEDDAAVRRLMCKALTAGGYNVLAADGAESALGIAAQPTRTIDLLLSDLVMPNLSGPDLAQRVVAIQPSMVVLYVSGFGDAIGARFGALGHRRSILAKPCTPDGLLSRVRECLDARGASASG
jgi:CheY-like chemotaxis protein